MWEDIDFKQDTTQDLTWVAEVMQNNNLVWTTDGSYGRRWAADLSGVGLIIFRTKTGLRMTGTFWEKSPSASSFWAEMLGLCALHIYAQAIAEYFNIKEWTSVISCDNKHTLELSSHHQQRI